MNKKDFLDVRLPKSIEERSKISENKQFCWELQLTSLGHC